MRGAVPDLRNPHPLHTGLPAMLQEDELALAFVGALDGVLAPIPVTLDNLDAYVDPGTAPSDWLPFIATWLGVDPAGSDDAALRRQLRVTPEVQAMNGTVAGVAALLREHFGTELDVTDSGGTTWSATPGAALPGEDRAVLRIRTGKGPDADTVRRLAASAIPPYVEVETRT